MLKKLKKDEDMLQSIVEACVKSQQSIHVPVDFNSAQNHDGQLHAGLRRMHDYCLIL
jgi:hypothetical protein